MSINRILSSLVVLAIAVVAAAYLYLGHWNSRSITLEQPVFFDFLPGTQLKPLAQQLKEAGIIDDPALFEAFVRLKRNYASYKSGYYRFAGEVSPQSVQTDFQVGSKLEKTVVEVRVPEGANFRLLWPRLIALGIAKNEAELRRAWLDRNLLKRLGIETSKSIEGFIFPAKYPFAKIPSLEEFLTVAVANFQEKTGQKFWDGAKLYTPLTQGQIVAFASLIEAETKFDSERAAVSEVIWARLKAGSPLGIDAALIYGIPDYKGDIKWAHLKDTKNPYNSRIYKGLPPTAIGSPGLSSLQAVLNPTKEGYYYYVRVADDSGKHLFARTLKEHNRNVEAWKVFDKRQSSK